jgi:indole-3-glycerol phosphate synthase
MLKTIPSILAQIVEQKRLELRKLPEDRSDEMQQRATESVTSRRDFLAALTGRDVAVIAEIKRASPSRGILSENFKPAAIADAYQRGGAAALSVLTDHKHFGGSLSDLESARRAVTVPALRKDFTIDRYHVHEAAAHGADAILLIAAILTERDLRDFRELAEEYRMAALVEIHGEEELKAALQSGARIIGVNNRDLHTFEVNLNVSLRLAEGIPADVVRVAESGIHSSAEVKLLRAAGYHGFLVGEHLMKSSDPAQALRALLS